MKMKRHKLTPSLLIGLLLIGTVFISGCTAVNNVVPCQPNWIKNNVFVLNDQAGWDNCKTACYNSYQTSHAKVENSNIGATCYCDVNKCSG